MSRQDSLGPKVRDPLQRPLSKAKAWRLDLHPQRPSWTLITQVMPSPCSTRWSIGSAVINTTYTPEVSSQFDVCALLTALTYFTVDRRREVDGWPDPTPNHQDACKKRQRSTTGVWFLETAQYNEWKKGLEPFLFWLYGKRMFLRFELLLSKFEPQRDAAKLS